MTAITFEALMDTIGKVAQAEKITKEGLRTLSRDILSYVLETEDVRPVNTLLGQDGDGKFILTPINHRIAVQYFHHFIAFSSNWDDVKDYAIKGKGQRVALAFNKKSKKRWDKCAAEIAAWLEDEANDIWSWSNNVKMDAKPVDYAKEIQKAITKAMDEDKGGFSMQDVVNAMIGVEEVSVHDLMAALEGAAVPKAEQVDEAA
tara:strand:+ start:923 stop:1531 length:609 start_codon:yes stop_codon:yes gene_type:complete